MSKTIISPFMEDVLSIPQVHELIGKASDNLYNLFIHYSTGTNAILENQFISLVRNLDITCENLPTTSVRRIFQEVLVEHKGKLRKTKKELAETSSTIPPIPHDAINFICFVECLIRIVFDKFAYLQEYTLSEKLDWFIQTRIEPHYHDILIERTELEEIDTEVEKIIIACGKYIDGVFNKYRSKNIKYQQKKNHVVTLEALIKFCRDIDWLKTSLSVSSLHKIFSKATGRFIEKESILSKGEFLKAMVLICKEVFQLRVEEMNKLRENEIEMMNDEINRIEDELKSVSDSDLDEVDCEQMIHQRNVLLERIENFTELTYIDFLKDDLRLFLKA
eukprot:TRINITY_DN3064_c0_g1_i3.p1 TRINITY_DN3064_c0_g1~~TRINITY_DN3064_c0_g1_i3.p1  ORF type:complete len:334 (+),score=86.16 TRINITY_DN3064_c0_g1_i3:88-1089(+)